LALRCGGGAVASEAAADTEYIAAPVTFSCWVGCGVGLEELEGCWCECELRMRARPESRPALSLLADAGRADAGTSAMGSSGGRLPDGRVLMPPLSMKARLPGSP